MFLLQFNSSETNPSELKIQHLWVKLIQLPPSCHSHNSQRLVESTLLEINLTPVFLQCTLTKTLWATHAYRELLI